MTTLELRPHSAPLSPPKSSSNEYFLRNTFTQLVPHPHPSIFILTDSCISPLRFGIPLTTKIGGTLFTRIEILYCEHVSVKQNFNVNEFYLLKKRTDWNAFSNRLPYSSIRVVLLTCKGAFSQNPTESDDSLVMHQCSICTLNWFVVPRHFRFLKKSSQGVYNQNTKICYGAEDSRRVSKTDLKKHHEFNETLTLLTISFSTTTPFSLLTILGYYD